MKEYYEVPCTEYFKGNVNKDRYIPKETVIWIEVSEDGSIKVIKELP